MSIRLKCGFDRFFRSRSDDARQAKGVGSVQEQRSKRRRDAAWESVWLERESHVG